MLEHLTEISERQKFINWNFRSSHPEVFLVKGVCKETLLKSPFGMGIFAAYFQNIFYYEHLWTAASETSSKSKMELSLKYHEKKILCREFQTLAV